MRLVLLLSLSLCFTTIVYCHQGTEVIETSSPRPGPVPVKEPAPSLELAEGISQEPTAVFNGSVHFDLQDREVSITIDPLELPVPGIDKQAHHPLPLDSASMLTEMREAPVLQLNRDMLPIPSYTDTAATHHKLGIEMGTVFAGAPWIYSLLLLMSIGTVTLWLYNWLCMGREKLMPASLTGQLETYIEHRDWIGAQRLCATHPFPLGNMVMSGMQHTKEGYEVLSNGMQLEGKRACSQFWRCLALLNDVAVIAPMVGLLGTVLGMFYAFYNPDRSTDSIGTLFDGLGVSVGTTVAGLILSILALILHSMSKYRLARQLTALEKSADRLARKMRETENTRGPTS